MTRVSTHGATWAITGATGQVASVIRPAVRERIDAVRLLDVRRPDDLAPNEKFVHCDITADDVRRAVRGVAGIVHLAAIADEVGFDDAMHVNLLGTHRVLDAARRNGVARVVFASTNHVTGMYPADEAIDETTPVRPDGFYAVSKVAGEAIARLYADKYGLQVVAIRIGSCLPRPTEARHRHTWLSPTDTVAAFWAAMNCDCDGFAVFYGVSANTRRWWSLDAGHALGFVPVDDAERELGPGPSYTGPQGGEFASFDPEGAAG